jgi:TBC1 domain family protein 5
MVTKVIRGNTSRSTSKVVGDDPLSVMASMEEERAAMEKLNRMERKKRLLMESRPHMKHHPSSVETKDAAGTNHLSDDRVKETSKDSKTRWDEFYSSKETMDIIKKDLDRLPLNHHIYFNQLKERQCIDDSFATNDISLNNREERSLVLSQILFVYAREHKIGYRQGMHEILSFVMMAIEKDLIMRDILGLIDGPFVQDSEHLLNKSFIVHDTYTIFDAIMSSLSLAFGHSGDESRLSKPVERTGDATIRIIREFYGDDQLADFLMNLDVPPELYCTRWIRLMFSREVVGLDEVFNLWDTFFNQLGSGEMTLINILETAAASMIILIKDQLLPSVEQYS